MRPAHVCGLDCRIDFHTHIVVDVPDFAGKFGDPRWPTFHADGERRHLIRDGRAVRSLTASSWSPRQRIEDMDAAGIVHQVLSPIPPMICDWAAAGPATEWAERINAAVADIVSAHPRRFSGLGTVPLHHPDAAVAVLHRAHQAGLSGVEIGTTAGSRELDHLDLREFFCAAEELEMLIFVHPLILGTRSQWTDRIVGAAATFGLSMGTDTAIAATRLAFGGVTRKCPGLRICLAHGGGTFFWALPRISRLWDATNDATAADLVQNIYADTVVYRDANLHFLRSQLGPHRMVFGTDYPLPAHDDLSGSMLSGLGLTDARLVGTDTAARLLNVPIGH